MNCYNSKRLLFIFFTLSICYNLSAQSKNHWTFNIGVRAEWTSVDATIKTTNKTIYDSTFLDLFPSAKLGYKFNIYT